MPAYVNLVDVVKIAVISYAFIFAANRVLDRVGAGAFKA